MARRSRARQLPLDWTTATTFDQATSQEIPSTVAESATSVAHDSFSQTEINEVADAVADEIDWVLRGIDRWLDKRGKPISVDAYQDLVEAVLYKVVGYELSLLDDEEYKYCHLTGIDQVVVDLTEGEHSSEEYRNRQGIWAHLPPDFYYQIVEHPTTSPEQRIAQARALWQKIIGTPLPSAPWER
jgi:hypothetical protein